MDSLDAAIYTTDLDGRITLYNNAAATLWGREPELGKDLWCGSYKIFRSDGSEMQLDQCPMAVCLKENRPVYGEEILVARPDGSQRKVAPHPRPLYDASGKMVGAINLLVDITELKATEEALRESEAKYRQLAERLEKLVDEKTKDLKIKNQELASSEDRYHKMVDEVEDYAIILLDKYGIIQNWNRGAEKIKGYTEKEIVGRSFNTFYFPEDLNSGLPEQLLTLAKKSGKAIHEGWRKRKDGSRFWGSTVLTALHDAEGNVMGFTKVTRDLTERKLAEERLKEYTEELEFKNKELEQFAYAASHDLKEPLRKIHLYNESIADNVNNTLDLKSREYLSRSMSAVHRMNKLIEDLLEYSTMTANVKMIQAVDLNDVFKEIIFSHKDELDNKEIFIDKNKLPVVQAVPFQMKQLFSNLVNNSIKYKRPGIALKIQIESVVATANEVNKLLPGPRGLYHKISVIDNGIGFEQHYSEKIFEIFQRLDNGIDTKGSGIGLALCKRIVQNHHGAIDAISEANKGARFDVYLPDNP